MHSVKTESFELWFSARPFSADAFKLETATLDLVGVAPVLGAVRLLGGMAALGLCGVWRNAQGQSSHRSRMTGAIGP